ncbi:MAG: hypothetical protein HY806_08100, partial [Nitrospirae bacterium]|nr:hypothetical protein [Nitrospirota bacterium]
MFRKLALADRALSSMMSAAVILAIFALTLFFSAQGIKKKNSELKAQIEQMTALKDDIRKVNNAVKSQERKMGLTKAAGAVSAIEQNLSSLGLKAKTIKPAGMKNRGEFSEEDAEVIIEGVDLNKIVNLIYKIENSVLPLKIKTANIKTNFENPEKFIFNLTIT